MTVYRVYVVDAGGHTSQPPQVIECNDDQEALKQARQLVDGKAVEVWNEAKRVGLLEPDK